MGEDWPPVREWHRAVNERDSEAARSVAADGVLLGGPRGQTTGIARLLDWIGHSGIRLTPVSWHPVDEETVVVEQDATWPDRPDSGSGTAPVRLATLFRVEGGRVTAVLRFDGLDTALAAAGSGGPTTR